MITVPRVINGQLYTFGDYSPITRQYEFIRLGDKLIQRRYTVKQLRTKPKDKACNIMITVTPNAYIKTTYSSNFIVYDGCMQTVSYKDAIQWLAQYVCNTSQEFHNIAETLLLYGQSREIFESPYDLNFN